MKAPGFKLLKLKCDDPLSNFAYKFNLRRYNVDLDAFDANAAGITAQSAQSEAGA